MKLKAFLDGDSLCIVREDFVDLQESPAFFIELDSELLKQIQELEK